MLRNLEELASVGSASGVPVTWLGAPGDLSV